jgi:hypothetical protein
MPFCTIKVVNKKNEPEGYFISPDIGDFSAIEVPAYVKTG